MILKCEICGSDVEEHIAIIRTVGGVKHVFCSVRCEEQWEGLEKEEEGS